MKIYKIGHCCLVIEDGGTKIMTDPGRFTDAQLGIKGLDAIIITHTHSDHLDQETFKDILVNNSGVRVIANQQIADELSKLMVHVETLKDGERAIVKKIQIKAEDHAHAHIYDGVELPHNTGYHINDVLYLPGDSLEATKRPVKVLALPVGAPWQSVKDSLDYAKKIRPQKAFPIHDGMLKVFGPWHGWPKEKLPDMGIEFIALEPGQHFTV